MRPLAERWDGRSWRIQTVRVRGALTGVELDAVSCPSSDWCMAAGPDGLAQTWNGRRWSLLSLPGPPGLTPAYSDVSCYDATSCMIVGEADPSCAENGGSCNAHAVVVDLRLSGRRWTLQKPPQSYGALALVACPASERCVATGVVAEVYDGRRWSVQRLPGSSGFVLDGLSCAAANACTAVGSRTSDTAPVAEAWNGLRWTEQPLPAPRATGPNASSTLNGVSCPTRGVCLAVGAHAGANGLTAPFAEHDTASSASGAAGARR
jgi:hypothetical protein